ncbi:type I phosphodiesterase/nucleotide pyrophosphatase [Rubrobacter xylanophilus DSM 9941]|uniref:Type I phosphodiesterase/nucleotide pyrophosphatase n=1 Tax=Rubrobacter xylanophilus (strain DSM 9941 / JCM 11954 / NBRC 16129 / PRD-1) TaxID=266117 RepID=Q1AUG9_RUBXD|nr:type I phosphodiesterase/nucleotide pyrophosphatase [Rubrobacter xylanophilus DSM 9941]
MRALAGPATQLEDRRPVLLLVLDGIRPDVMRAAVRAGDAPSFAALAEHGEAVWDCASVFPSITPAATAAIATGRPPAGSGIVGHAWYDRREGEMVIYGAKTETVLAGGPIRVFHNHVWRMNRDDLLAPTIFETLHRGGVEGACVHFPIRRGPYEHPVRMRAVEGYLLGGRFLGRSVEGPKEYYLGDLFYTRRTGVNGFKGSGGLHRSIGINDEYAAAVGERLLEEGAEPFTLIYFFQGDQIAHREGLAAQRRYVSRLDGYAARLFAAAGGLGSLLERYAVLVVSDHGHDPLLPRRGYVDLSSGLSGFRLSLGPRAALGPSADAVAVPNGRAALLYLREPALAGAAAAAALGRRGVDVAAWREGGWFFARRDGREVSFRPGGALRDPLGGRWELRGDPGALDLRVFGDAILYGDYPDALERLRGCLQSPRSGDVVLSAAPGYSFGEVSGAFHAASDHGSLHASDSEVFALASGVRAPRRITEVAPSVVEHFAGAAVGRGL